MEPAVDVGTCACVCQLSPSLTYSAALTLVRIRKWELITRGLKETSELEVQGQVASWTEIPGRMQTSGLPAAQPASRGHGLLFLPLIYSQSCPEVGGPRREAAIAFGIPACFPSSHSPCCFPPEVSSLRVTQPTPR